MDKLQPLIRNHFWILVGLVVPLVLYGYYSANGALKTATLDREKTLTDVKSGVSSGNEPNEDYVKKLEHINTFLDASVQDAIVDLWRKQQERMTWPQAVASRIPSEFMAEFEQQVPFIYKGLYPELIRKLQLRAQPVEPLLETGTGGAGMGMDRSGRPLPAKPVVAKPNQKLILAAMVPHAKFGQFGITSQEMWDAQIDIWLTEILLDAIVKMNEEKESISEAVIRRVDLIELMGGTGVRVTKDSGAAGGDGMMGGMSEGMPGMGRMGAANIPTTIAFLPQEEFGPALEGGGDGGMGMEMGMSAEGGVGGPAPPKRYIAETEDAPFLERGFYLSVIIQQTKIADFIVTLANSDWPVQVRRFQVGANPYAVDTVPTGGDFGSGMEGLGGMSGMGGGMSQMGMGMSSPRGMGGRFGGMGEQMGSGFDGGKSTLQNYFAGNLPEYAMGALNHPDLVQLDLCGIITMYKQPKDALAAIEARKAANAAATAISDTQAAPAEDAPVDPNAMPAVNGDPESPADPTAPVVPTVPANEAMPAPDGEAVPAPDGVPPVAPPGAGDPATASPPATAPASAPTAPPG